MNPIYHTPAHDSPEVSATLMPPTPALQEALNASITSGRLADTKIYLFFHRDSAGNVRKPKALYANSVVLKSVPYFNDRKSSSDCVCTRNTLTSMSTSILWELLRDYHERSRGGYHA